MSKKLNHLDSTEAKMLREIAATPAGQRAIRRALWRARFQVAWYSFRYRALQLFYAPGEILAAPEGDPRRYIAASIVIYIAIAVVLLAAILNAAELPPHARAVGGGWYECEQGYLMRAHACVAEAEALAEPRFEISKVPSAGDGSRQPRSSSSSVVYVDRYVGPYGRYGGPYPDYIYDSIQSGLSPGARVVPIR